MKTTESSNREYYEALYAGGSGLAGRLKLSLSFDQRAKTRRNLAMLANVPAPASAPVRVLDYGCGRGAFLHYSPWRPAELFGVDLAPAALQALQARDWGRQRVFRPLMPADLGSEALDASMDIVCASHVLEHVDDADAVLDELIRVTRPGGHILINVPINEVYEDPRHVRAYTPDAAQFERPGLSIVASACGDRWSGFLLTQEYVRRCGRLKALLLRALRALLAQLPLSLLDASECLLPSHYQPGQFLVLCRRAAAGSGVAPVSSRG